MLNIDATRPLKRATQVRALVQAVLEANVQDEADWVEWKIDVDLGAHDGQGTVARHILGLANRDPVTASRFAGGYGYLLAGVEPSSCPGIVMLDPATLEPRVQQFLDDDEGPGWQPIWVTHEGSDVLVVIIDPPRQGDPIHTLAKAFGKYQAGEVFVRYKGRTDKARPADIRRLTARAQPDLPQRLAVALTTAMGTPPQVVAIDCSEQALQPWLDEKRADLLAPLEEKKPHDEHEPQWNVPIGAPSSLRVPLRAMQNASIAKRAATWFEKEEDRSPEKYREQIAAYLDSAREVAAEVAVRRHIASGVARIDLVLNNPTDQPFRDVEVILHVPGEGVAGFDGPPPEVRLPSRPRSWGPRFVDPLGGMREYDFSVPHLSPSISGFHSRRSVEIDNDGSSRIRFASVDLGPQDRRELDPIELVVPKSYAGERLPAQWEARSIHVSGVAQGDLEIVVADEAVQADELLRGGDDYE